jgi:branched-chain amino acid transport system ATP-binding protein
MIGAYTCKDRGQIKKELKDIFRLFPRLEERKEQMGGTLSGGEQQMLAIGRTLIARPEMIMLDEPSLGIAPIIVKDIFQAIKKIREEGTTILFVEQNSRIALKSADRAYVFQTGEVVIADTCENLRNNEEVKKAYLGG